MKFLVLVFLMTICFPFHSCELIEENFRQVPYLLESTQEYEFSYSTGMSPKIRFLTRQDFDIPGDAVIEKFAISDIKLQINSTRENDCADTRIFYSIDNDRGEIGGTYEQSFESSLTSSGSSLIDDLIADVSIAHTFDASLAEISSFISQNVINNNLVALTLFMACRSMTDDQDDIFSHKINIKFDLLVEYVVCEDVFGSTDLSICI